MSLRTTAARTVGGMISAARIPADTTLWLVGRTPLGGPLRTAIELADAGAREVAGRVLGGDEPQEPPEPETARRSGQSKGATSSNRQDRARRKAPVKQPRQARPGEAVSGFPEPPGKDPGDISRDPEPHHALSNPVDEPDPTEWPDPYDPREDPLDPPDPDSRPFGEEPHVVTGSMSTSEPHPSEDPEAGERQNAPERDRLDD